VTYLTEYEPNGTTVSYTRESNYNAKSQLVEETTSTLQDDDDFDRNWSDIHYYYDSNGNGTGTYQGGAVTKVVTANECR
jgi:hypothetical protein